VEELLLGLWRKSGGEGDGKLKNEITILLTSLGGGHALSLDLLTVAGTERRRERKERVLLKTRRKKKTK